MPDKNYINIAVFVSGGGTNLQALINAQNKGDLKSGKITLVVSSKQDAYALKRAEKAGIETAVVPRKNYACQRDFDMALIAVLEKYNIGLIVLAGYLSILSADFTKKYDHRIINVHPSLIPSFCGEGYYGLKVHEQALQYGVKVTGATVHYVNEIADGGEIIFQKAVAVRDDDTPETLQKRVMKSAEWKLLPKAAEAVAEKILNEENT